MGVVFQQRRVDFVCGRHGSDCECALRDGIYSRRRTDASRSIERAAVDDRGSKKRARSATSPFRNRASTTRRRLGDVTPTRRGKGDVALSRRTSRKNDQLDQSRTTVGRRAATIRIDCQDCLQRTVCALRGVVVDGVVEELQ